MNASAFRDTVLCKSNASKKHEFHFFFKSLHENLSGNSRHLER